MLTRLRRTIDVRLLPLTAAMLLSACALHRKDARPDGAPAPAASEEPALPHIDLPPIDVPTPDITFPEVGTAAEAAPPITRWVTHAPAFARRPFDEWRRHMIDYAQPTPDRDAMLAKVKAELRVEHRRLTDVQIDLIADVAIELRLVHDSIVRRTTAARSHDGDALRHTAFIDRGVDERSRRS